MVFYYFLPGTIYSFDSWNEIYTQFYITLETANIFFVCFRSTVYNLSLYDLSENVEQVSIFYLNMRICSR